MMEDTVPAAAKPSGVQSTTSTGKAADLGRKRRLFRAFETNKEREMAEQQESRRYYHAKQWTDAEMKKLRARGQPPIFDNRIARKIDFLVGVEQRMRRDPKAYPRTPKHEKDADIATSGLRFVCDTNRWETKASNCTHDGLVTGIGVIWIGVGNGPMGLDVELKPVSVDRFFYDPRSEMPDFSDARYMGLHLWLDIEEAKERYPKHAEALESLVDRDSPARGGLAVEQDRYEQWGDFEHQRVRVIEFWERRLMTAPYMQSTAMTPVRSAVGWYFCTFTGDIELEAGPSPYMDENGSPDCPYVAWSPYVDERGDRYSPVRNMRPMQDEVNHRRSKLLHLLNVRQVHYREGDVDDVDHMRSELSRPDGVVKHNGEWGKTVGLVDQSQQIDGQAELLAQAQSSLENLGPNPGLIGKGGGVADQSGRAILAQRDSGMTELSPVFERLRDWKLRCYRKMWGRMRQAWDGERWIRITDDDGAPAFIGVNQYEMNEVGEIVVSNSIAELDVDIILEEGPDTITMQEELMQTLANLGEAAAGPLGRIMIELSNTANKDRLLKMLDRASAPDPQVAAMQARMAQLEEILKAAQIDEKRAGVENKRADTLSKLLTASTPQQQQTDEFGNPTGAPPAQPNLGAAVQAMGMFPLQFGEPLLEEQAMDMANTPPPEMQPEGDPAMAGAPMNPMMPQAMPPDGAMPGGLPISPELAGMGSVGSPA